MNPATPSAAEALLELRQLQRCRTRWGKRRLHKVQQEESAPKKKAKVQPAVGKGYKRCEQCQQVGGVALSRLTAP